MMTRLMTLPQNHMINCFRIYYRELCEIVFILSLTIATSPSVRFSSSVLVYIPYNWENKNIQKMKLFLFLAASALAQDVDVCKTNCESRHEAELARCNGDERCINHANDMFRRCLHDCDNGGEGPPSCTDNCDRRLQDELRRCGDDEECQKRAKEHHEHCMDNCENHTPPDCEDHCHHQHEQETSHCKDDDQACHDRADHHLQNCLNHCEDGPPEPPTCEGKGSIVFRSKMVRSMG